MTGLDHKQTSANKPHTPQRIQKAIQLTTLLVIVFLVSATFMITANASTHKTPNPALASDNPVLHITFNEAEGTTAQDSSTYNNTATLNEFNFNQNSGWTQNAIQGNALAFDGINDYVSVPDNYATSIQNQDWTVSMWVHPNTNPTDTQFLYNDGGDPWYNTFRLSWTTGNQFQCFVRDNQNRYAPATSAVHTPQNWYQIIGVWNQNQKTAYIYVDGILEGTWTKNDFDAINTTGGTSPTIGGTNNGYLFNGTIDEVTIYNRALTTNEITQLFTTGSANEPTLTWMQTLPYAAIIIVIVVVLLIIFRKKISRSHSIKISKIQTTTLTSTNGEP